MRTIYPPRECELTKGIPIELVHEYPWFVTGHRPEKLFPGVSTAEAYSVRNLVRLIEFAKGRLRKYEVDAIMVGMAQGWDTAVGLAAVELGIPVCAVIPCEGQEKPWPTGAQSRYLELVQSSRETVILSSEYHGGVMIARNRWMIEQSRHGLALFDGEESGGTWDCYAYAKEKKAEDEDRRVVNCWKTWMKEISEE